MVKSYGLLPQITGFSQWSLGFLNDHLCQISFMVNSWLNHVIDVFEIIWIQIALAHVLGKRNSRLFVFPFNREYGYP